MEEMFRSDEQECITLPWPETLLDSYNLNEAAKFRLQQALELLEEAVSETNDREALIKLEQGLEILNELEMLPILEELPLSAFLEKWEIEDYDTYFDVKRERNEVSYKSLVRNLLLTYKVFLKAH